MSDFLSRLAGRVFTSEPAIRPRLPTLFEPALPNLAFLDEPIVEVTPEERKPPWMPPIAAAAEPLVFPLLDEPLRNQIPPIMETVSHREMPPLSSEHSIPALIDTASHREMRGPSREHSIPPIIYTASHREMPARSGEHAPGQSDPHVDSIAPQQAQTLALRKLPAAATAEPHHKQTLPVPVEARVIRQAAAPSTIEEKSPPAVNVTIGRIEVRAVHHSEPPRIQPSASPQQPHLSLDAYLTQRRRGIR